MSAADREGLGERRRGLPGQAKGQQRAQAQGGELGERHAERQEARSASGLVSFKTTQSCVSVNLAPSAAAERRVKRLKRSVWLSGRLHGLACKGHRAPQCWFVTLTYRGVADWRPEHMGRACTAFRNWCKAVGVPCRYTWVAELQQRGAVHYHLLAWLPRHVVMPKWDLGKGKRAAFWPHGMTNTEKARAGVGYLMKYLSKFGELTRFPKGLRLYGIGGLNQQAREIRSWYNLPEWAKRSFGVGELARRAGRLVVRATGEILEAVYHVCRMPSGLILWPVREIPERFHAGAYSTWPMVTP